MHYFHNFQNGGQSLNANFVRWRSISVFFGEFNVIFIALFSEFPPDVILYLSGINKLNGVCSLLAIKSSGAVKYVISSHNNLCLKQLRQG